MSEEVWRPGDPERVATALRDTEAVVRRPEPSWSDYLAELSSSAAGWELVPDALANASELFVIGVVLVLAAVVAFAVARLVLRARRRRIAPVAVDVDTVTVEALGPGTEPRDAERWWRELGRRLDTGDVAGAVEALWWWVARRLGGGEIEPSYTSRDLLRACGRQDLGELAGELDDLQYGPHRRSIAELRELAARLNRELS